MDDMKRFFKADKAGFVLGGALLTTLVGCTGWREGKLKKQMDLI
jgi:hypothetical protein